VVADGPYGLAFGSAKDPALVTVDPRQLGAGREVGFHRDGKPVR
jgi:hypothetical protein